MNANRKTQQRNSMSLSPACENIAQRMTNAETRFAEAITETIECDMSQARGIMAFYLKNKIAKRNGIDSINVIHGAFMGRDVLLRAMTEMAK